MFPRIHGLVAASHTPFHGDGSLNLAVVEQQAEHLLRLHLRQYGRKSLADVRRAAANGCSLDGRHARQ